ncbi:ATP-binding protein [Streptomyces sp. PVA_94-07]|nr:ATP-binding protein [Streptomyces sp. PVA_94-07]
MHAEAAFCFDPFSLYNSGRVEGFTNPNAVLAGIIGMGKSALAKSIATRSIAHGYRIYIPCDPKGEWTAVSQALGGYSIALGPGLPGRLNRSAMTAMSASGIVVSSVFWWPDSSMTWGSSRGVRVTFSLRWRRGGKTSCAVRLCGAPWYVAASAS